MTSVSASRWHSNSRVLRTGMASHCTPLCVATAVCAKRSSSACLNTCTFLRAYIARRTKRISSSDLPANMLPQITVS